MKCYLQKWLNTIMSGQLDFQELWVGYRFLLVYLHQMMIFLHVQKVPLLNL